MSTTVERETVEFADNGDSEFAKGRGPIDWLGGWASMFWGMALLAASFIGLRIYQQQFAWWNEAGLDSASSDFKTLLVQPLRRRARGGRGRHTRLVGLAVEVRSEVGCRRAGHGITPAEEVRRVVVFWGLIGVTSVVLYFMASFFPNQDGVWHQTTVRDTALTPTHIVMFYWAFPMGITMAIGTYLYGRTRLPKVYSRDKGFPGPSSSSSPPPSPR